MNKVVGHHVVVGHRAVIFNIVVVGHRAVVFLQVLKTPPCRRGAAKIFN
jgi:acetyltransferase-like isoleucine patch superfamily enzyme